MEETYQSPEEQEAEESAAEKFWKMIHEAFDKGEKTLNEEIERRRQLFKSPKENLDPRYK